MEFRRVLFRSGHARCHALQRGAPPGVRPGRGARPSALPAVSRRRRQLRVAATVVVLVGAAGAFVLWPRGTTEVSKQEALDDFRSRAAQTGSGSASDAARSDGPAALPAPCVYTYSASGQEEVKLGPLPADARPLPATVTAVVEIGRAHV